MKSRPKDPWCKFPDGGRSSPEIGNMGSQPQANRNKANEIPWRLRLRQKGKEMEVKSGSMVSIYPENSKHSLENYDLQTLC